jgi:NAD(P)-dependent dehydrogenase (short-subunit alcohol dehydrogenase family)
MSRRSVPVALITGGNRGLGLEAARQLGRSGTHILIGCRDRNGGHDAADHLCKEGIAAECITLNITNPGHHNAARDHIENRFGRLDILINNAGVDLEGNVSIIGPHNNVLNVSLETITQTFEINFFGAFSLTRTLLPLLRNADAGRIVNVSSILGSLTRHSDPSMPLVSEYKSFAYGSSKTLLNAFTVYLAHALRGTVVKVNSAHPGWAKTSLGGDDAQMEPDEAAKTIVALALLDADGPTGGFFHLGEPVPW